MKIGNWTIRGVSIAGRHTTIVVDELKLCFDLGIIIDNIERTETVLISHGHGDHIGSLHIFLALRHLHKLNPPLCVMPEVCIPPFKILSSAASALDRGKSETILFNNLIKCDVKAADSSHLLPLSHNSKYFVSSIPMIHKIISFGYCIYNKRSKLKGEYIEYTPKQLKELRSQNVEITRDIYFPEIAFTGDTLFKSIIENEDYLKAKLLIMECTLLDDMTVEEAQNRYHVHILELIDNYGIFENDSIILTHFSDRYSSDDVRDRISKIMVDKGIPSSFTNKIYLHVETGIHKLT